MTMSLTDQEFADMTGLLGFVAGVLTFTAVMQYLLVRYRNRSESS